MATPIDDPPAVRQRPPVPGRALVVAVVAGVAIGLIGYLIAFGDDDTTPSAVEAAAVSTTLPAVEHAEPVEGTIPVGRSPDVPDLPFADNPDPTQCGIPLPWNGQEQAWLTGIYDGELIQPEVLLYNSHLRLEITASAAHGTEVSVVLHQANPVLDYYLVQLPGQPSAWIPEPFLSFEPPDDLSR